MDYLKRSLAFLKEIPGKVFLWIIVGGIVLIAVIKFVAKSTTLKAKEMNLGAIIQDALDKFKIKQNKDKIKDLDAKPKKEDLEKNPNKVEDFYKDRK